MNLRALSDLQGVGVVCVPLCRGFGSVSDAAAGGRQRLAPLVLRTLIFFALMHYESKTRDVLAFLLGCVPSNVKGFFWSIFSLLNVRCAHSSGRYAPCAVRFSVTQQAAWKKGNQLDSWPFISLRKSKILRNAAPAFAAPPAAASRAGLTLLSFAGVTIHKVLSF
jgi:hypothetical protein